MYISDRKINLVGVLLAVTASALLFLDVTPFDATNYNLWGYSEWQINYEGGWIRRGLFGQLLLRITDNQIQGSNMMVLVVGLLFIWLGIVHLFRLNGRQKLAFMAIFFLGTVGIVNHLVNNQHYFRKEYFSMLVLLIVVLFRKKISRQFYSGYTLICLILVIIAILNHESFVFAHAGVLVFLFWHVEAKAYQKAFVAGLIAFTFLATLYFHGDKHTADLIWMSLSEENRKVLPNDSAIQSIGWDLDEGLSFSLAIFQSFGQFRFWLMAIVIVAIQFAAIFLYLKFTCRQILGFLLFNLGLIPLFFLGRDWGRWLNLATFNLAIVLLELNAFQSFVEDLSRRIGDVFRSRLVVKEYGFIKKFRTSGIRLNSSTFISVFMLCCVFYIPECCMHELRHIISMTVKEPIKLLLNRP